MLVLPHVPHASKSALRSDRGPLSLPLCRQAQATAVDGASASTAPALVELPTSYNSAVRQAQAATQAALDDGHRLLEVEFPTSSLGGVSGDAEGAREMTASLGYLRQFCRLWSENPGVVRIFFPDKKELDLAQSTAVSVPESGSSEPAAVFTRAHGFQLDYLTQPTFFMDMGLDLKRESVVAHVQPSDAIFLIAYPHFNVNEMLTVEELWEGTARDTQRPIIVFNGELDRIRSSYYPPLFYPKIGRLAKNMLPHVTTAYFIHNFKGSGGGTLFRAYPGPWQVLRKARYSGGSWEVIHTQDSMPSLKEVALDILPRR